MTERDDFDVRLGAAVHAYLGGITSDLDPAELAHRIASGAPRRRGFPTALAWRGVAIARLPWALLLLMALVVAMVAGMLVIGSRPDPRLPAMLPPIGQLAACPPGSTSHAPGPPDQARPPQDAPMAVTFDRRAGRLMVLAGVDDEVETWAFDVCTNSWTPMRPAREPVGLIQLVYDGDADLTIGVASCMDCDVEPAGIVWAYDRAANTWTERGPAPRDAVPLFHDPVSGLVVAKVDSDARALWDYDVQSDTWSPVANAGMTQDPWPGGGVYAYDASVDRVVAYGIGGTTTWLFDLRTGIWSESGADTPAIWGWGMLGTPPATLYDEATAHTVVFGADGRLAAFDATADRWEVLSDGATDQRDRLPITTVYDPVRKRLVGIGWPNVDETGAAAPANGVVAFDVGTRAWSVLLEPRGP